MKSILLTAAFVPNKSYKKPNNVKTFDRIKKMISLKSLISLEFRNLVR